MKWNVGCLALTLSLAAPALAGVQALPDSSRVAPAGDGAIAVVTLTNGTIYRATTIRPLRSLQMVKISMAGGRVEHVSANRVKSITGIGGEDLSHRVLAEGRQVGVEDRTTQEDFTPRAGSIVLGSDLGLMRSDHDGGTVLQLPIRAGAYVSPWLELESSVSMVFPGYPVVEGELSVLVRPGAPGSPVYARFFQGGFWVTPGKPIAPATGVGIGVEVPARSRSAMRLECGYSHIFEAPDIASSNILYVRCGVSVFR